MSTSPGAGSRLCWDRAARAHHCPYAASANGEQVRSSTIIASAPLRLDENRRHKASPRCTRLAQGHLSRGHQRAGHRILTCEVGGAPRRERVAYSGRAGSVERLCHPHCKLSGRGGDVGRVSRLMDAGSRAFSHGVPGNPWRGPTGSKARVHLEHSRGSVLMAGWAKPQPATGVCGGDRRLTDRRPDLGGSRIGYSRGSAWRPRPDKLTPGGGIHPTARRRSWRLLRRSALADDQAGCLSIANISQAARLQLGR